MSGAEGAEERCVCVNGQARERWVRALPLLALWRPILASWCGPNSLSVDVD